MYDGSMDTLHFMVEVRATGWIGLGVANQAPNNMFWYDVGVGGVFNGSGYLQVNGFPSRLMYAGYKMICLHFDVPVFLPLAILAL